MADVKLVRAYDPYANDSLVFSIVSDGKDIKFIFPKDMELFDGDQRVEYIKSNAEKTPKSAAEWVKLAVSDLTSFNFKFVQDEEYDNLEDTSDEEQVFLDEMVAERVNPNAPSEESYKVSLAIRKLMASDKEIEEYMLDPDVGLSLDKRKLLMATMIIAADTVEYNPWLLPWLNGEELDPKEIDSTLVLSKPLRANLSSESFIDYEGDDE